MVTERLDTVAEPELEARLARVREAMEQQGLDVLYVGHSTDLEYLAGVERRVPHYGRSRFFGEWAVGGVIARTGDPVLLVPRHMAEFHFDLQATPRAMRVFTERDDPQLVVGETVRSVYGGEPGSIGVNLDAPAELVLFLQRTFPRARVEIAAQLLASVRAIKSDAELRVMRDACLLADRVFEESLKQVRPDLTERQLARWLNDRMVDLGATQESFDTAIFAMGTAEARPASERLSARPLGERVSVSYDFGAALHGYCSDFGRTIHLGEPSERFRRAYEAVIAAQAAGAEAMRPGTRACDVDAAARRVIEDAGFGEFFRHRLGHAIGKDVHEPPYLDSTDATPLAERMTFTIEPSVFITGEFGARVEDVYVVTPEGGRRLNEAGSALRVLS